LRQKRKGEASQNQDKKVAELNEKIAMLQKQLDIVNNEKVSQGLV